MHPIPGLFPPCTPPKFGGVIASPRGGLRHVVFTDAVGRPHRIRWVLRDLNGKELLRDDAGEKVFRLIRGTLVDHYLITDPAIDKLPLGTCVAHVLIDDVQQLDIPIVIESNVFQQQVLVDVCAPGINQVGTIALVEGDLAYQIVFPIRFRQTPTVVLTQVLGDTAANPVQSIVSTVMGFNERQASGVLDTAPDTGGYRLGWVAWC